MGRSRDGSSRDDSGMTAVWIGAQCAEKKAGRSVSGHTDFGKRTAARPSFECWGAVSSGSHRAKVMRIRLHLNGEPQPLYAVKVPPTWHELVAVARARLGAQGHDESSRPLTRLFLPDGAEVGSLDDLEEGDLVCVALDGADYRSVSGSAVTTAPPPLSPLPPAPASALSQARHQPPQAQPPPPQRQPPPPQPPPPQPPLPPPPPQTLRQPPSDEDVHLKGTIKGVEWLMAARERGDPAEMCHILRQLARLPASAVTADLLSQVRRRRPGMRTVRMPHVCVPPMGAPRHMFWTDWTCARLCSDRRRRRCGPLEAS